MIDRSIDRSMMVLLYSLPQYIALAVILWIAAITPRTAESILHIHRLPRPGPLQADAFDGGNASPSRFASAKIVTSTTALGTMCFWTRRANDGLF
jgi:hypothetical protein